MQTNPDSPAYYATDGTIYKDGEFALSGALTGNWNALIFATHNSSKESDEVPPNWSEWKQLTVGAAPTGRAVPITRSGPPGPAPGAVRLPGRQPDGPLRHHSPDISAVERQQPARPGAPDWGELVRSGHLGCPQESIGYLELQF